VFANLRMPRGNGPPILSVANFTPLPRDGYRLGVPERGTWRTMLDTDAACYGGSNYGDGAAATAEPSPWRDQPASLVLNLPPLAAVVAKGSVLSAACVPCQSLGDAVSNQPGSR